MSSLSEKIIKPKLGKIQNKRQHHPVIIKRKKAENFAEIRV